MKRRNLLGAASALALAAAAGALRAQDQATELMQAPKIVDLLRPKEIVLDLPEARGPARRRPAPPRAAHLHVAFDFGSARLLQAGRAQLDELALALEHGALRQAGFVLAGHTDRVGGADYNLALSLARAEAAKTYLVLQHGVREQRLQTLGHGYSRLLDPLHPASAVNRRVEVRQQPSGLAAGLRGPTDGQGQYVPTPGGARL